MPTIEREGWRRATTISLDPDSDGNPQRARHGQPRTDAIDGYCRKSLF